MHLTLDKVQLNTFEAILNKRPFCSFPSYRSEEAAGGVPREGFRGSCRP